MGGDDQMVGFLWYFVCFRHGWIGSVGGFCGCLE